MFVTSNRKWRRALLVGTALAGIAAHAGLALAQSTGGNGSPGFLGPGGAGGGFGVAGGDGSDGVIFLGGAGGGGGAGAAGGRSGDDGSPGNSGGSGGASGSLGVPATNDGGAGGENNTASADGGGGGGGGGNGILITTGGTVTVSTAVAGGKGGRGGNGTDGFGTIIGAGGGGGSGGFGIVVTGPAANISTSTVTGGAGGAGGDGGSGGVGAIGAGNGGSGGDGIYLGAANSILTVSSGSISGGAGGVGGATINAGSNAIGGAGGSGVEAAFGAAITLNAATSITGGNGAAANQTAAAGAGAVGITGSNLTILNAGAIAGGFAGNGAGAQAYAIVLGGGANHLTTQSGGSYSGGIDIASGTLYLDQTTVAGANASVTYSSPISGAGALVANSNAGYVITLSGANTYTGDTTVSGGTLVSSGSLTSAVINNATFNNSGTLTGSLTNNGTANISGGPLNGSVTNNSGGIFNLTGTVTSTDGSTFTNAAGATANIGATGNYTLAGSGFLVGPSVDNAGSLTIESGGKLSITTNILSNSGTLLVHGTLETTASTGGSLTNTAGTTTIDGAVNGGGVVISGGSVLLTGTGAVNGPVRFVHGAGSGVFDISGTTAGASIRSLSSSGGALATVELGTQTLTIDHSANSASFGGTIQGSGGLIIGSGGFFSTAGIGEYTGATTVQDSAILFLRSPNAIAASSVLNITSTNAQVAVRAATNIQSLQGIAGSKLELLANLTITNASTAFAGVINDNNGGIGNFRLTLTGGQQTLDGTNTYTGATNVNGGTLTVNGSIATSSMTTVNTGGTLGGTGIVGSTSIEGGTLSPGNGIGALTVQGSLVMTAASTYLVEVSPGNADRVNVTGNGAGTATLGGATVRTSYAPGSYLARQYTILNATGGRSGVFSGPVSSNLPSAITQSLSYDADNVYLNVALTFGVPGGLNGNQQAVGNALTNYFNSTGGIPLSFALLTASQLTQASGETAVGSQQATFDAMNQFMGVLGDLSIQGRDSGGGASAIPFADETLAYADKRRPSDALAAIYRKAPSMAPGFMPSWSVWAAGFGGSQTTDGNAGLGSNTATSRVYGTAVGADYRFSPNTIAGFALAGGGTNFGVANAGVGRTDLFQAGAFIRHHVGPAYLSAVLAYGWQDVTTDRTVGADRLQARFNANAFSGRLEGGYRYATPWMGVTPYAAAQVTVFELPNYAETAVASANTFALAYGAKDATVSRSELGLRTDKSFALGDAALTLRGRAAWAHNFDPDRSIAATFQALPGASFVVNGAAQARDAALTTASAEMKFVGGISLLATFEGEFSDVTRSYAGKGAVRYAW